MRFSLVPGEILADFSKNRFLVEATALGIHDECFALMQPALKPRSELNDKTTGKVVANGRVRKPENRPLLPGTAMLN